jgi:hypothetical protein
VRTLDLLLGLLALIAAPQAQPATARFDHTHALWTEVLAKHVAGDRFDYAALKKDRAVFDRYLAQLRAVTAVEHAAWTREQQFAFWINVYNAHVVDLVVRNHPLESIKDLGGLFSSVWKKSFIEMPALHPSGKPGKLSLDEVEHAILRPRFEDARVHAAINCASLSCPALRNEAFVAARLNEQLDQQVQRWIADPTRNQLDRASKTLRLSKLFDWFRDDFVRDGGSQREWVAKYAPADDALWIHGAGKELEIEYLDYSWKLNDVVRAK